MLPMLQKHIVIVTALALSMSITACSKKKDVIGAPPTQTADQKDQNGKEQKPHKGSKGDSSQSQGGSIGGGLPNQPPATPGNGGGQTANPLPPRPLPDNQSPSQQNQNAGGAASNSNTQPLPPAAGEATNPLQPPPVVEVKPAPALNPVPGDYRSDDANSVTRNDLSKRLTGGVTSTGLVYTSTSTDSLLDYLRARNEKVDADSKALNLAAAASVKSAKISSDDMSGDTIVTLKIHEGSKIVVYNIAGAQASSDASTALRRVRTGNNDRTTGQRPIEGTVKCLDLDGGCDTMFVRVKIGETGSSAIINLVFRSSSADPFFAMDKDSDNSEYMALKEFMLNSIKMVRTDDKMKSSVMKSWEVVNGRSGFTVAIKGFNQELIAFAGPLLAPEAGTGVNIPVARIAKDHEDTLDLLTLQNSKLNYANTIGDARLVANNGLGQIRILIKMRKRSNLPQDRVAITYMRQIKPLVELNDRNLR